jgi:hypothetical protein
MEVSVLRALIVGIVLFLIATFPATFLLMLFLGNIDVHLSYWGTFPLGILVSVLIGASGATGSSAYD